MESNNVTDAANLPTKIQVVRSFLLAHMVLRNAFFFYLICRY